MNRAYYDIRHFILASLNGHFNVIRHVKTEALDQNTQQAQWNKDGILSEMFPSYYRELCIEFEAYIQDDYSHRINKTKTKNKRGCDMTILYVTLVT